MTQLKLEQMVKDLVAKEGFRAYSILKGQCLFELRSSDGGVTDDLMFYLIEKDYHSRKDSPTKYGVKIDQHVTKPELEEKVKEAAQQYRENLEKLKERKNMSFEKPAPLNLGGGLDLGGALGGILNDQIKQQIAGVVMGAISQLISNLIAQLFARSAPAAPVDPPLIPVKPTPDEHADSGPTPFPPAPVTPTGRVWSGMKLSLKGVKRDGKHINHEKIKQGLDPAVPADVLNFDIDPLDQFGVEIGPGSPELTQLLLDPENPYDPSAPNDGLEGRMRIQYAMGNFDFAVNGTRWQYGCSPNVKVDPNLRNVEKNLVFSAFATNAQGKAFQSNVVRVNVKDTRK